MTNYVEGSDLNRDAKPNLIYFVENLFAFILHLLKELSSRYINNSFCNSLFKR